MTRSLSVAAALVLLLSPGGARAAKVMTNLDDVQACEPLPGGRVLLGTSGGLVLVGADGQARKLWTRLDGLPGTRVHALLREDDRLWVGTDRGLARLSVPRQKIELVLPSKPVRVIARHGGKLHVGTWGGGVLRLENDDSRRPVQVALAKGRVTSLASVHETIYTGTAGSGLWKLTRGKPAKIAGLPSPFIWSLAGDGRGSLHVGTLAGLSKVSADSSVTQVSSTDARALHRNSDGRMLVGGYGSGLEQLPPSTLDLSFAAGAFVNVIQSAEGTTCIGTRKGAWLRAAGKPRKVRLAGPPSNDISALAVDEHGGRLHVGTFDGGLAVLERGVWRTVRGVDRRVDALAVQREGRSSTLWVGTSRGLYRVRGGAIRRFGAADGLRHQHVHSLAVLRDGSLLAGTGLGAAIIRGEQVEPITVKQGLPVASVWAAAEDRDGSLWLGTSRGLYHWSRTLRRYTRYSVSSGHLAEDWITAITLHDGAVYVGTYNAGVTRLTRAADGEWTPTHLGGGWVNFAGLEVVGKTLYAASMSGLHRLSLEQKDARFERVPGAAPGRDVTVVAPGPSGRLWIASRRGLALSAVK
jgi:ligand-binding sensor domain-containing protein